jgi:hypothetical protein
MKSVILHIGIPKTGSSALQVFCAQNRAALLSQGYDYFELGDFALGARGKISSGNGAHLARSFLRPQGAGYKPDRDLQLAALDRKIAASASATGLLSSEHFVFADDAALTEFSAWLSARGVSLQFFYYVRDQIQFLTSSYIQQVKRHACTETAEEYILRVYAKIAHIKYSRLFERLAKIAGPEQIICENYQDARALPHGICDTFVTALGLDARKLKFAEASVNVSLDLTEIKIMLALNQLKPRMVFSDLLVENAARRGRKGSDLTYQLLSQDTLETLEHYFADDNARFARSYFRRDKLFEPPAPPPEGQRIANAEPTLAEVMEVFGGLLVRFDERLAALERRLSNAAIAEAPARNALTSVAPRPKARTPSSVEQDGPTS